MLFVIAGIGRDRYAIPACDIVEIAPIGARMTVTGMAQRVAGLIEYRGRAIPLLDLGELCRGVACTEASTTRILIVKSRGGENPLAIRAERVASTVRLDEEAFQPLSGVPAPPYMSGVALMGDAIIQRIDIHRLAEEQFRESPV